MQNFLQPEESDIELLNLELSALVSGAVQQTWSPVLYLVAVHHVNRFLYLVGAVEDETVAARDQMWAQVISCRDKVWRSIYLLRDVVFLI